MKINFDDNGKIIVPECSYLGEDNAVFKCNWNDAKWKGICSKEAREYNVAKGHPWCIDSTNPCEKMIKSNQKDFPCMESCLFLKFSINPGNYLKGNKRLEERHIRGIRKGKIAFLTTISPEIEEKDRYFIGLFDIEKVEDDRHVFGNKETSIIIPEKIKIKFWDYFENKDESKKWSSGRFRYINDELVLKILQDLKKENDKSYSKV